MTVRFDDRLETILRQPRASPSACAAVWGQVADIVAQDDGRLDVRQRGEAIGLLHDARASVPVARRTAVANSVARSTISPDLLRIFAVDVPVVAAPILRVCTPHDDDWAVIIPDMPPTSRALLRERRDLSPATTRMLNAFGSGDFALPTSDAAVDMAPASSPRPTQISDLVARIEAFRRNRDTQPHGPQLASAPAQFRFESDEEGVINWVDGVGRGAVIGMTLATMAAAGGAGVDGQAVGAFRKRAAFQGARMLIPGARDAAGTWLITATPLFNADSGAFAGYRGAAVRVSDSHTGAIANGFTAQTGLAADSVRQLVHELRTPLNAIRGFGEMISGQILGPVSSLYRHRADAIVGDSGRLIDILTDLEAAARLDGFDAVVVTSEECDLAHALALVALDCEAVSNERGVRLRFARASTPELAAIVPATCAALIGRLVGVALDCAARDETIDVSVISGPSVTMVRPLALQGMAEATLLDPTHESDLGPPLGMGFTLRLIGNMARAAGAQFRIDDQTFTLIFPEVLRSAGATKESS